MDNLHNTEKKRLLGEFARIRDYAGLALHTQQSHAADGQKRRPQLETAMIASLRDSGDEKSETDICL